MTKRKDTSYLMIRNAPPKDLIKTVLKQIGVIHNKELYKVEESIFVILSPILRDPTNNYVIHNISMLMIKVNSIQLLIREAFRNTGLTLFTIDDPR